MRIRAQAIAFVAIGLAGSMSVSALEVSTRLNAAAMDGAKAFEKQLQDTVWQINCGQGEFKAGFGGDGQIVLNKAWEGYLWAVTDPSSITMTGKNGARVYFSFSADRNEFKFVPWEYSGLCVGRKVA